MELVYLARIGCCTGCCTSSIYIDIAPLGRSWAICPGAWTCNALFVLAFALLGEGALQHHQYYV